MLSIQGFFLIYRIGQDWIRSNLAIGVKWIGTKKKLGTVGLDICITFTAWTAMLVNFVYFSLNETVQHTLSLSNGKKIMFICRSNRAIKNLSETDWVAPKQVDKRLK